MTNRVAEALLAVAAGGRGRAIELLAENLHRGEGSDLGHALHDYLAGAPRPGVYAEPAAFTAFIDGGGNVALYETLIEELSAVHRSAAPATVLDIGCGDGRVTSAVLAGTAVTVDLVEPSADLLSVAVGRFDGAAAVTGHGLGAAEFLGRAETRWDLAQSTFALHNLAPPERRSVLPRLASLCDRLLVAEFDVPALADRSPEHAAYAADRYERGLAEYSDPDLVARGFLMPVLVGQFDPDEPRHTFEQPIDRWVAELETAGFHQVTTTPLVDYWWAPAVLLDARHRSSG
jgi:SAM-dependent methyltransferase